MKRKLTQNPGFSSGYSSINIVSFFIFTLILITSLDKSFVSEWCQRLHDKSVSSVFSPGVNFLKDLSFNDMRRFVPTNSKKAYNLTQRKNREKLERVHEKNFEISRSMTQILMVYFKHLKLSIKENSKSECIRCKRKTKG